LTAIRTASISNRTLAIAILAAGFVTACATTPGSTVSVSTATPSASQPTPSPSTAVGSNLAVAGEISGDVAHIRTTCGQQQVVGNNYTAKYLSADGSLNGDAFHADIYDPAGPGSWEGGFHIYVSFTPPNSDYYAWFTQSSKGISNFSSTVGGNVAATIPPKPSADIQAGGLSPNGPITLRGTIVC
jgi:hypothetical protein